MIAKKETNEKRKVDCVLVADVERDYVVRCDGVSEQFSTCRQNGGAGQVVRRESSFCPPRSLYQVKNKTQLPICAIHPLPLLLMLLFPSFCCRRGGIEMRERQIDQTREICFPSAW